MHQLVHAAYNWGRRCSQYTGSAAAGVCRRHGLKRTYTWTSCEPNVWLQGPADHPGRPSQRHSPDVWHLYRVYLTRPRLSLVSKTCMSRPHHAQHSGAPGTHTLGGFLQQLVHPGQFNLDLGALSYAPNRFHLHASESITWKRLWSEVCSIGNDTHYVIQGTDTPINIEEAQRTGTPVAQVHGTGKSAIVKANTFYRDDAGDLVSRKVAQKSRARLLGMVRVRDVPRAVDGGGQGDQRPARGGWRRRGVHVQQLFTFTCPTLLDTFWRREHGAGSAEGRASQQPAASARAARRQGQGQGGGLPPFEACFERN